MKKASTVICLRNGARAPFEVLMVQRKKNARFMSGLFVFPGGVEEESDSSPQWRERVIASGLHESSLSARVCALREVWEEAGLVLPNDIELRKRCKDDATVFLEQCANRALDVTRLKPFAHWITPKQEKYRYDTQFFVLHVTDKDGEASVDNDEVTTLLWQTPAQLLDAAAQGKIMLAPPTWVSLQELSGFTSIAQVLSAPRSMKPIEPILSFSNEDLIVALPGDSEHDEKGPPGAMRRVVRKGSGGMLWIDTVGHTTKATSNL